ncbi:ankyrin repeat-containing [Trichoderma arundinaceum]|uniref:Ankyrin repeat-containing n=1 Tax=Trichoderma arundinaceum TaxID=490622 RepID=A0A395NRA5_TRIAR|nr:ankyrin repeat-containing [Trichoderma arundinaceum]
MVDILAHDARKLAELRDVLQAHVRSAEKFVKDYYRHYGDSVQNLAQRYAQALWAIPDIEDSSTRTLSIITSITVGLVTLLATFNMGHIAGVVQRVLRHGKDIVGGNGQKESPVNANGPKSASKTRIGDYMVAWFTGRKGQVKQQESKADGYKFHLLSHWQVSESVPSWGTSSPALRNAHNVAPTVLMDSLLAINAEQIVAKIHPHYTEDNQGYYNTEGANQFAPTTDGSGLR